MGLCQGLPLQDLPQNQPIQNEETTYDVSKIVTIQRLVKRHMSKRQNKPKKATMITDSHTIEDHKFNPFPVERQEFHDERTLPRIDFKTGRSYIGSWKYGLPSGRGKYIMEDGYESFKVDLWRDRQVQLQILQWINGFLQGKGHYQSKDGSYYVGDWKDSLMDGYGTFFNAKSISVYEGQWKENRQNGFGLEMYNDQSQYEGNFLNGLKEGQGKFTFADGSIYIGQFKNDQFHGKGVLVKYLFIFSFFFYQTWDFGNKIYDGDWVEGKKQGFGQFKNLNKLAYEGEYVQGLKEGVGTMVWNNGRKYVGKWKKGFQHGDGQYFDCNGTMSQGIWKFGKLQQQ